MSLLSSVTSICMSKIPGLSFFMPYTDMKSTVYVGSTMYVGYVIASMGILFIFSILVVIYILHVAHICDKYFTLHGSNCSHLYAHDESSYNYIHS